MLLSRRSSLCCSSNTRWHLRAAALLVVLIASALVAAGAGKTAGKRMQDRSAHTCAQHRSEQVMIRQAKRQAGQTACCLLRARDRCMQEAKPRCNFKDQQSQPSQRRKGKKEKKYSRSALPLHAAGAATTEGRCEGEVNVLLAVHAHHEAGDVHHLLANPAAQDSTSRVSCPT